MKQYGDWVFQTDVLPEGEIRQLLEQQARNAGVSGEVEYQFNKPYRLVDPETGEFVDGFASSWKVVRMT